MLVITGGAGFIGSNLLARLEQEIQEPLIAIDTLGKDEKWKNLRQRNLADLILPTETFTFLNSHISKIKAIFHLGAISTTTETDADLVIANNLTFSSRLLEWCTEHQKQFIYASSAATYGDGSQGFNDGQSVGELKKLLPLNVYGWSKHAFDLRIASLKEAKKPLPPQYIGLKFFNVYGPNEYHKGGQQSVVSHIFESLKTSSSARLFKSYNPDYQDGCQLRDFIWVDDCIDIMVWLYQNPHFSGLFNIGTGKARSFLDLAHAVFNALNRPSKIKFIEMPESLREKYQYYTQAQMTSLQKIGYQKPFTSLEEGAKKYVQNYLTQLNPYR
ncbi:MAG: ADP-glyceromanno-heptose 6-epimerase [Caedibacter sp. 37-49]|nr:MAG: ADP-glyceromanno-heptose 6-epimerase [Caedibacter sp. 37-49]